MRKRGGSERKRKTRKRGGKREGGSGDIQLGIATALLTNLYQQIVAVHSHMFVHCK